MEKAFTAQNFETEVLKAATPVLVDFYAEWCGPCKMMGPVIEKLAEEFDGRASVGKLNIDESESVAAKYGIMTVPTIILFKGGEIVQKWTGVQRQADLEAALNQIL